MKKTILFLAICQLVLSHNLQAQKDKPNVLFIATDDLNTAIAETGAEMIYVTHGYTDTFSRWLNEKGIQSAEVKTMYGDETEDENADANNSTSEET